MSKTAKNIRDQIIALAMDEGSNLYTKIGGFARNCGSSHRGAFWDGFDGKQRKFTKTSVTSNWYAAGKAFAKAAPDWVPKARTDDTPEMREQQATDPMKPSLALLVKLGSIAVHADEMLSPGGHEFDKIELQTRIADPEVQAWMKAMGAFLPVKR